MSMTLGNTCVVVNFFTLLTLHSLFGIYFPLCLRVSLTLLLLFGCRAVKNVRQNYCRSNCFIIG